MTREQIVEVVLAELANIAPETDAAGIDPQADIREALDMDSMDVLNFVTALHERLGLDVPEADYLKLTSVAGATDYLADRLVRG